MKTMECIEKWISRIALAISGSAFVIMVTLITVNVFARYIFSNSLNWAEEVAYLCFNWAVFFGVVLLYANQGLTAIDLLVDRMPKTMKKISMVIGFFLVTLANIGLIVWGTEFAIAAFERKSPALKIPYFFYDLSIPLAGIFLLYFSVKFLVFTIKNKEIKSAALEERS